MAPEAWLRPSADRRVSNLPWQSRSSPGPFHPSVRRGSGPRPASACARWRKRGREQISERSDSCDTSPFADTHAKRPALPGLVLACPNVSAKAKFLSKCCWSVGVALTGSLDRSRCRTAKGRRARSPGRGAGSFAKRRGKIQHLAGAERSSSCAPCRVPPAIPFGLYGTIVAWRGRDISDHFRLGALRVETLPDGRGPKFRYKNGLVAATPQR